MQPRHLILAGIVFAGLSVAAGAFGAHWLKGKLAREDLAVDEQQRRLDIWDVAVRYQMYHGLALIALGLLASRPGPPGGTGLAGGLFMAGIVIFSGCLYLLVLTGVKILGAIVPIGGVAFLAGWVMMAVAVIRSKLT